MSALAAIVESQYRPVHCGPFWLRVRMLDSPAWLDAQTAMKVAQGVVAEAERATPLDPARLGSARIDAVMLATARIVSHAVVGIALDHDGEPGEWEPCTIVVKEADEDVAAHKVSAAALDHVSPGYMSDVLAVAMHLVDEESKTLRPFSGMSDPSSG